MHTGLLHVKFLRSTLLRHSVRGALLLAHRGQDAQHPSPLGLPMTEELLADSFLKRLFARFYGMLRAASGSVPHQLQVGLNAL